MRVRRTALRAATQPIAASYFGSGYSRFREQARSHILNGARSRFAVLQITR